MMKRIWCWMLGRHLEPRIRWVLSKPPQELWICKFCGKVWVERPVLRCDGV